MNGFSKYGLNWGPEFDLAKAEIYMIRQGGQWKDASGRLFGNGLFFHYKELQKILWPEDDHHRWSDLVLSEILRNTITCILGPKDSGKTRTSSKYALTDYFCWPECTMILISSTDLRGLEMRIWGDLKGLFERAHSRFDWLPGNVLEAKHAIFTDNAEEGDIRDQRKGIICIPCMSAGGAWQGISKYVGLKQKRRRLIGDEFQLMKDGLLESVANLNSGDFKGVVMGNPIGQEDPLDKMSEPKEGWTALPEPEKTTVWENRWIGGRTINLVGIDSPNFDVPEGAPIPFPYMINRKSMASVEAFYGRESQTWYSQCKGVRRSGLNARRVISRELCEQFGAFDDPVWESTEITRIIGLDAAYSGIGGDRCVAIRADLGKNVRGEQMLAFHPPVIVPVSLKRPERPEDQIAEWMREYAKDQEVQPEHVYFDATGRGSLGTAFARVWSAFIEPLEFGGRPTVRPVSLDLQVVDRDTGLKRLKQCDEHYSKFVTELWFAVRYAIEAGQIKALPDEVAREGYLREWKLVRADRIEIESKEDTKKRMGRSPDYFDAAACATEGARRLGFQIKKLAQVKEDAASDWLSEEAERYRKVMEKARMQHV